MIIFVTVYLDDRARPYHAAGFAAPRGLKLAVQSWCNIANGHLAALADEFDDGPDPLKPDRPEQVIIGVRALLDERADIANHKAFGEREYVREQRPLDGSVA